MFAFVIWDAARKRLFAARDRVGIKPLYYLMSNHAFVFGSEIKAVAASGYSAMKMSLNAFSGFVRFLVVPQPDSIFEDIKKLEPGHFMLINAEGEVHKESYWSPGSHGEGAEPATDATWAERLTRELQASVAYHMVADVPVGAFLSGGLDSSAVVSLMREHAPDQSIDAFSIGFPGNDEFDEDRYAREVARLKNINFHTGTIDENFLVDMETMAWHLDEPFAVSSAYATFYLAKSAARNTKVVLTGDGGDELFAGYMGYLNNAYLKNGMASLAFSTAYHLVRPVAGLAGGGRGIRRIIAGLRRRCGSEGLRYSEQVAQSSLRAASMVLEKDVFIELLRAWDRNRMAFCYDHAPGDDRLQKKLYAEFSTRLVDEMLMKVDRMTMAHSLEARVPLLDHRVVELAFRLPSAMKLRKNPQGDILKYALKKSMEKYLPGEIIYRRKQGFNIPVRDWFKGRFLSDVKELLLDGQLQEWGVLDRAGLSHLVALQQDGRQNFDNMLMVLLAFEMWVNAYRKHVGKITFR